MFMLAHCLPITLVQLGVPHLLRAAGEDPALCGLSAQYALRLLPSLYIEAFNRPLNRILIAQVCCCCCRRRRPLPICMHAVWSQSRNLVHARSLGCESCSHACMRLGSLADLLRLCMQRIAAPQAAVSIVVALLHVFFNYLLIHVAGCAPSACP